METLLRNTQGTSEPASLHEYRIYVGARVISHSVEGFPLSSSLPAGRSAWCDAGHPDTNRILPLALSLK